MEWSYFCARLAGNVRALVSEEALLHAWIRDQKLEVSGIQLIVLPYMERHVFSRDFLFLGFTSQLPEDPARAPHDCVCVADAPLPKAYLEQTVPGNLIVLAKTERTQDLSILQNHISFVLADDYRFFRGLEAISRVHPDGSLREAVRLIERLVTNPAALLDSRGKLLAVGGQYAFTNRWLREVEENGGLSPAQLREIQNTSVYMALREDYYRHADSSAWAMYQFLCVPVRVRGLVVAQLVIELAFSAFHLSSVQLMDPIAKLLAELIDRRMEDSNDRSLLHSMLFLELLHTAPERETELQQRIEELHWQESPRMQLLCCQSMEDISLFEQLRRRYPTARWTVAEEQWLLLLYPDEGEFGEGSVPLEQMMTELGLRGGCSWFFDRLKDLPYAWQQARIALERGGGALTDYASVFAFHVCTLSWDEMPHYLHPAIELLARYDRSHDGNLLDTLEAYLSGPEQPVEAAARLYISRSTLFYRINRIRELCGLQFATGEERMNLLLSLRLWRVVEQLRDAESR